MSEVRMHEFRETFRVGNPWSRFFSAMWSGFGLSWNLYRTADRTVELRARRLLLRVSFQTGHKGRDDMWRTFGIDVQIVWFDGV